MPDQLRSKIKVLIMGSDSPFFQKIASLLEDKNSKTANICGVAELDHALLHLRNHEPSIIFAALNTPKIVDAIKDIRNVNSEIPIITFGYKGQEHLGVEAVKAGAQDCIFFESLQDENLYQTIQYAIERRRIASDIDRVHRNQLQAIIESVSDGVVIASATGEVLFVNPAAEKILQISALELISNNLSIPFKLGEKLEYCHEGKHLEVATSILPWDQAEAGYCVTIHDVSSHKALQERLERASTLKDEFIAHMSHELRTPMNGIVGMASLLEESGLDETQLDYVETIRSSSNNMLEMIGDLLDLSKIEAGRLVIENTTFNLKSMIEDTLDMFRKTVQDKNILLTNLYPAHVPEYIKSDSSRLRQIIVNLLSNAIRHTDNGFVQIEAGFKDNSISLTVRDSGVGIPKKSQEFLFKPFTQLSSSPDKRQGGTGLGLVICKKLSNLLRGEIQLDSSSSQGSSFTVTIPSMFAETKPKWSKNKKKICFIGCDPYICKSLKSIYETNAFDFANFSTVSDITNTARFELIIVDRQTIYDKSDLVQLKQKIPDKPILLLTPKEVPSNSTFTKMGFSTLSRNPLKQSDLIKFSRALIRGEREIKSFKKIEKNRQLQIAHNYSDEQISGRVLVAEDNATNQKVIESMLKKIGLKVDTVTNGNEAIEACKSINYDAILMDCRMPLLNGFEATKEIRLISEHYERVPLIAVTAEALKDSKAKCQSAGMDGCLIKPIDLSILRNVMKAKLVEHRSEFFSDRKKEDENFLLIDESVLETLVRVGKKCGSGLLQEVFQIFKQEFPDILETLQQALEVGNFEEVENLAHKLKGSARNIGAKRLASMCHDIEEGSFKGISAQKLNGDISDIKVCFTETCCFLDSYIYKSKKPKAG